ncbi:IS3 family transposase [Mucilaginibacter sp.]|uniref:IS3 family transposase n=1 Tax=Mucilaginibacter sp. TaxID=1882438 RepID=UPI0025FE4DF2|nr:IS3 family transposase [Mucilaginibacter sp.]
MKFGIIREIGNNVDTLCGIAGVSRSGYYKWLKRVDAPEKDHKDYLLIKEVFDRGRGTYGWRTLQMKLKAERGIVMNHKKIIRIKNKYRLITTIRRRNPYKYALRKTQDHRTFRNTLNRQFNQKNPYRTLCTDITYVPFHSKMVYLSAVKDIASREIVAWHLSNNITMDIALRTIENLKRNRNIPCFKGILIHSDQGSHYTNPEYVRRVRKLNMVQSMSRKGKCVDNAPMESFFGHFKDDIDYKDCKTFEELKIVTGKYIEYYNNERQQWNLKKMTPVEYRNHLLLGRQ